MVYATTVGLKGKRTLIRSSASPSNVRVGADAPEPPSTSLSVLMAIYRLSAQLISRGTGRSAVASSAYRAGVSMEDARLGLTWDYSRRRTVVYERILAPMGAPAWVLDRAVLWNGIEAIERRKDAQLARELQVALPQELELEDQVELLEGWVDGECVALGMVADLVIHADKGNPHGHVLLTLRALGNETFGLKAREWNRPEILKRWRESWAVAVNMALAARGISDRVDHRTLAAQGIDREPKNLGRDAVEMERRGVSSRQGEALRERQRARDQKRKEKADGTRRRGNAEPEVFDLTWGVGLSSRAVALDGGRDRGGAGEGLEPPLAGPRGRALAGDGPETLGGADAPGSSANPGAELVGGDLGARSDTPLPAAGELGGADVMGPPPPDGATGGPQVAPMGEQGRGPVREALNPEDVYARATAVKDFANELGRGLIGRPDLVSEEGLDSAVVEALRTADPLMLAPRPGYEDVFDQEGNHVYSLAPQTPRGLPIEVEELNWAMSRVTGEPEGEPTWAELGAREAFGLEERPEAHYDKPWAERREDLVQDGLRLVAARTSELQEVAERQAEGHVGTLWGRLQDAMRAVSQWGHDLVDSWRLSREVRRVERDLATITGRVHKPEPLPRDPAVLRELFRERQVAAGKAWQEKRVGGSADLPRGPSKGRSRGE